MMRRYYIKNLKLDCPEGYGQGNIWMEVFVHFKPNSHIPAIRRKELSKWICALRYKLLRIGVDCSESCAVTPDFLEFKREIIRLDHDPIPEVF